MNIGWVACNESVTVTSKQQKAYDDIIQQSVHLNIPASPVAWLSVSGPLSLPVLSLPPGQLVAARSRERRAPVAVREETPGHQTAGNGLWAAGRPAGSDADVRRPAGCLPAVPREVAVLCRVVMVSAGQVSCGRGGHTRPAAQLRQTSTGNTNSERRAS